MKLHIFFLALITIGTLHSRSVQYAIKNTMATATKKVIVFYHNESVGTASDYQILISQSIKPNAVYAWNAENNQKECTASYCNYWAAYAYRIDVTPSDNNSPTIQTDLKIDTSREYSHDMYWVILPNGHITRVYQIYYDGTIFPFVNNDPKTGKPDMARQGQTFIPLTK